MATPSRPAGPAAKRKRGSTEASARAVKKASAGRAAQLAAAGSAERAAARAGKRPQRDQLAAPKPAASGKARATREDVLAAATRKWLRGQRLEPGRLAEEVGLGRATLFRWFGSREQLYGEVIKRVYAEHRARLLATAKGTGLDLLQYVVRRNLSGLTTAAPLRRFIEHDSELAIRVLTSPSGSVQRHTVALEVDFLRRVVAEAGVTPELDLETLAYIIVRIGEAFVYADTIAGCEPEVDKAVAAIRILVAAQTQTQPDKARARGPSRKAKGED